MKRRNSNPDENRLKNECIDRISNLPDSILGKILSYLPTKHAASTVILSTKWKNIFPFSVPLTKLDFDDSQLLHPKENESNLPYCSFISFVDRLLNETLLDVPCVDMVAIGCEKHYGDAKIVSWVVSALRMNVRVLVLTSFLNDSKALFHTLNGYKTLTVLRLGRNFDLRLPGNFNLPKLDNLQLDYLVFHDEESINQLLDGCPVLENLTLNGCSTRYLSELCIRSPLFKGVIIDDCWKDSSCDLKLDVPNLDTFMYNDLAAAEYSVTKFKSLRAAHIDVGITVERMKEAEYFEEDWDIYSSIGGLVTSCSSTIKLYLSGCTIAAMNRSLDEVPTFQNLTVLTLGCMGIDGWESLANLLSSAPNLEKLHFEGGFKEYEGGYASFESSQSSTPICLEVKLKKIKFSVFKGEEDEMKLIEYLLKNGKVLEKMQLHCLPCEDESMLMRLFTFPRHSKACRILLR